MARRKRARPEKSHNVYVVALDESVLEKRRFREANPEYKPGKPCLYVGMTSLTPKERFENHKRGHRASKYVRDYGKYLRRRLYEHFNPLTRAQAERKERQLAEELRAKGYAVWQK